MSRTRFLTGSLATLAVASAVTLASPSAYADTAPPCGRPGTPAVYTTIVTEPVFKQIPAVTHTEWLWQRQVDTVEYEFFKVLSPARTEADWTRTTQSPVEYLFSHLVVVTAAVPAIPGTPEIGHTVTVILVPAVTAESDEYQQQTTGKLRWESPDWGAQNGQGWFKTGNTRQDVIVKAVTAEKYVVDQPATPPVPGTPAVTRTDTVWASSSPGADWTGPLDQRGGTSSTENTTTDGSAPAGTGWVQVATRQIPATVDTVWAATAPEGYTPTGDQRVSGSTTETSPATSATPPAGDGWSQVEGSAVTVTDQAASSELVTPGGVEQVLVSPELPATDPCPLPPVNPDPSGPQGTPVAGTPSTPSTVSAPVGAQAAAPADASVLPNTGSPVSPWMTTAGLSALVAGGLLIQVSRRRTTS